MEKRKCKLCSRIFVNGKALGGHMKAHFASLPLPSPQNEEDEEGEEEKGLVYGLRENPKKSSKVEDPKFSFADEVVQDRESETESKNPTRKQSKRNRRKSVDAAEKLPKKRNSVDSLNESELPLSSVSDASLEDEDVAKCLIMLSRDKWIVKTQAKTVSMEEIKIKSKSVKGGKNRCGKCKKVFRTNRALCGHKKICVDEDEHQEGGNNGSGNSDRIFECPFCYKLFGSGQALGGHKRSHLLMNSTNAIANSSNNSVKLDNDNRITLIDLNLPAPMEEDVYSVVSEI